MGANEDGSGDGRLFEEQREALNRPGMRLFTDYGRERRPLLVAGLAGTLVGPILGLVPTYVLKVTIDGTLLGATPYAFPLVPSSWIPASQLGQIQLSAAIIFGVAASSALVNRYSALAWNLFAQQVQHELRLDAFERMQQLEMGFFTEQRTGQLLSVLTSDVNRLEDLLRGLLRNLIGIGIRVVGVAAVMVALNWQLALVAMLPVVALAAVSRWYSGRISENYGDVRSSVGSLTARIENSIDGIATVKTYTNEDHERDRVESASRDYLDAEWEAALVRSKLYPSMRVINRAGFAVILLVGGYWLVAGPPPLFSGTLNVGTLVAFLTYNQQFTSPLVQFGRLLDTYHEADASAERVFALLERPAGVPETEDAVVLDGIEGHVEYDGVDFSYPGSDERVLRNVDLVAEPGETVGLVGTTGAGKTTLVKLLARFHDPDRGTVRVDGRDLRTLDVESLRDGIAVVSQDPFLFDGTVRENVAYADPGADQDAVEAAARRASAHEFVMDLDDGYDTRVGERGAKLSGGQRQRIALARAVLRDPDLLVLDEATSHVDNETEARILANLADIAADRTTFVIAHRLSTVRNADQVVVLEDGAVRERGTHAELLDADGLYASLWRVQVGDAEGGGELLSRQD